MIVTMVVTLFTMRLVLTELGVLDYGIYVAVGGFVSLFSMVSGSLSVAISRFICVGMVEQERSTKLNVLFYSSLNLQIVLSIIIIFIAELLGYWFINYEMNIPENRVFVAHFVLHSSIFTFVIGLLNVPYNALIIAYEKMSAFAYISILEVTLKLLIVALLVLLPYDKLMVYSISLFVVSVLIRSIYAFYCRYNFSCCRYKLHIDGGIVNDLCKFIGWAFCGNAVVVLRDQGISVLLNIFCGPAVNAATAIAYQVNANLFKLVSTFLTAVSPQITKSYASRDIEYMHNLIIKSSKFGFFILITCVLPISINIDYVLRLWLSEVPSHTSNFIQIMFLSSVLSCLDFPLLQGILAQGQIRKYEITLTCLYTINSLGSYLLLKMNGAPEIVFFLNLFFDSIVLVVLLVHAKEKINLSIGDYIKKVILPSFMVLLVSLVSGSTLKLQDQSFLYFCANSLLICTITLCSVLLLGLSKSEKDFLLNEIKKRASQSRSQKKT